MSTRERLRANDVRFLAVAATLRPDEWAAQSLCTDWTNREILAHLVVGYSCAIGAFAAEMGRHRGAFNPANAALAREKGSSRTPPNCWPTLRGSSSALRASAGTSRVGCCSATTSPTSSTS